VSVITKIASKLATAGSYLHPVRDAPITRVSMSDGLSGGSLFCARGTLIDAPVGVQNVPDTSSRPGRPIEASSCSRPDMRFATVPSPRIGNGRQALFGGGWRLK